LAAMTSGPDDSKPPVASDEAATDPTEGTRRPGDDPFLPEEGFFWWLPRAAAIVLVGVSLILLATATLHHGNYRLVATEDASDAVLERGRFAPWGWEAFIPDGAVDAWTPIKWPVDGVEPPLEGELQQLTDTYLGFIRSEANARQADADVLLRLDQQEQALEAWYRTRWSGDDPPSSGAVGQLRASLDAEARAAEEAETERLRLAREQESQEAAETAAAAAAELAEAQRRAAETEADFEIRMAAARSFAADRRRFLIEAEEMLSRLPAAGSGTADQERDLAAIEAFVTAMDTPAATTP